MDGLKFRKLDLHIHTPASSDFNRPEGADDDQIAALIVREALGKGLDGIAITDHNSGEWVDRIKEAAKDTALVVFPGVEITTQAGAGVHILALLDPSSRSADVRHLLSKLDVSPVDYGRETTVVQKSSSDVITTITDCGALAVPAHVNSGGGILNVMRGQSRIQVVQHPGLRAVEATDSADAEKRVTRKRVIDLLDGTDSAYQRKLAVIQSSDNPATGGASGHSIEGLGTRCTWYKMEKIDLTSLRNCFDDPDVRILLTSPDAETFYPQIKSIKITGGFLDGCEIEFHEGLNSIIGSKGSGKSLLIELLRFALDQASTNPSIRDDHEGKLDKRLKMYGSIEATVVLDTGGETTIKRVYNPDEANPYEDAAIDIARLFPVIFLSQNEIIKIAEDEEEQLSFIDRFFDFKYHKVAIEQLENELNNLDKQYSATINAFIECGELSKRIETIETEIKGIDGTLKNPTFGKFSIAETKLHGYTASISYMKDLSQRIEPAMKHLLDLPIPVYADTVIEDPSLKRIAKVIVETRAYVTAKFGEVRDEITKATSSVTAEEKTFLPNYKTTKTEYEEIVRKMGGNYQTIAAKRSKLVKELSELKIRFGKASELVEKAKHIDAERTRRLDELAKTYALFTAERKTKCQMFETESSGKLKITLLESSNVDLFKNRLIDMKKGSYLRDIDIDKICRSITPKEFVKYIISYYARRQPDNLKDLAEKVDLGLEVIVRLVDYLLSVSEIEDLLELQYKAMPQDTPNIQFRLADGTYSSLSDLSVGQKCTAMLIMTLSDGTMPIVIDQPEDSLDIRSVWEDVCQKLRNGKEKRQFVFTTHNSSLAVASDSDTFIVMEADADKGKVLMAGAMDHDPVGNEVLSYLEGGLVTYRKKYSKYDIDRRIAID